MKNLLTLVFVLLLSASVAVAQSSTSDQGSDNVQAEKVESTGNSQSTGNGHCGSKAKMAGCCKKKSSAATKMNCHGKAQANAACCDKHANAGNKEEEE